VVTEPGSWMTNVDRALLLAEWTCRSSVGGCSCCHGDKRNGQHDAGCPMDLALAERGFHTQEERDRARDFVRRTVETAATLPPLRVPETDEND